MRRTGTAADRTARRTRTGGQPAKVQSILAAALKRHGLDQQLARYEFVLHWEEIVGADIARRAKPVSLKEGRLFVRVVSSTWAQELSFRAPVILRRLQKFLGSGNTVNDVVFFVGEVPASTAHRVGRAKKAVLGG